MKPVSGLATRALGGALGVGAAVAAYSLVERWWFRTRTVPVPVGPTEGPPLVILHLSDLHYDPPQPKLERFIGGLRALDYDLVVLTGDLLGSEGAEDATVELVAGLVGPDRPGLVVLGSNDVYAPAPRVWWSYVTDPDRRVHGPPLDTRRLVAGLERAGYEVLSGRTAVVTTRRGPVAAGGIPDPHLGAGPLPPVEAIRCPDTPAVLRLGLVHAPYRAALELLVTAGYELVLAGHTHGGQIRIPGVGALVTNCDLPRDRARGLSRWDGAWLHVSPGLGASRYAPVRLACRPEATLLTCRR